MTDRREQAISEPGEIPPVTLTITEAEYRELVTQLSPARPRRRGRQHVEETPHDFIFSVGSQEEIFGYTTPGHTRAEDRTNLRGTLAILDRVATAAVKSRGENGRFFGNRTGIHYKNRTPELILCLKFNIIRPAK